MALLYNADTVLFGKTYSAKIEHARLREKYVKILAVVLIKKNISSGAPL